MKIEIDGQGFDVPDDATPEEIDQITRPAPAAPTKPPSLLERLQRGAQGFTAPARAGFGAAEAAGSLASQALSYVPGAAAAAGAYLHRYNPMAHDASTYEFWDKMTPPVGNPRSQYKTEEERSAAIERLVQRRQIDDAGRARRNVTGVLPTVPVSQEGKDVLGGVGEAFRPVQWVGDRAGDAGAWVNRKLGGNDMDQEVVRNVYSEAVPAMGMEGLGPVRSIAREKLAPWLQRRAESSAVRSAYADRTALKREFGRPLDDPALRETGRFLLDKKIPLRSPAAMVDGLEDVLATEGPEIGQAIQRAQASGAKLDLGAVSNRVLSRIDDLRANTETRGVYNRVKALLDDQMEQHPAGMDPAAAHSLRKVLDGLSKWERGQPQIELTAAEAFRKVRGELSDELGATMDRTGLGSDWKAANYDYKNASRAKSLADVGKERRAGNAVLPLAEKIAAFGGGGLAAFAHNPSGIVAGLGVPALGIALNRWGFPVAARTSDALASSLARPSVLPPHSLTAAGILAAALRQNQSTMDQENDQ